MSKKELPYYTKGEEIFNAVSHIVGGAFGIVALILSIIFGVKYDHYNLEMMSIIIYGLSITILYTMSSIYHFLHRNKAKKVFRIFDHCTIYLLIAGTYSPICLIALKDSIWGTIIFFTVWFLAIIGITFNAINMYWKAVKIISMVLYVAMGWCIIIALFPLLEIVPIAGFWWLLAGGLAYTFGLIFYGLGKKIKYMHAIWHLFCLLGTIFQFVGIFSYIICA